MALRHVTFPEAKDYLIRWSMPAVKAGPRPQRNPLSGAKAPINEMPMGMTPEAAVALVDEAADRLWRPEGRAALATLTGPGRLLRPDTIRAARLGFASHIKARSQNGHTYSAQGVLIPWYEDNKLVRINVRQPDDHRPKYRRVFDAGGPSVRLFRGLATIRPGKPLVVAEGEFESLFLGQVLADLAAVVTLGSAGDCGRPTPSILEALLPAWPWFIALDADSAGDKAARAWQDLYSEARRIRPPAPFKDWTEAATDPAGARNTGVDLARWWGEVLTGRLDPPAYLLADLTGWRWGPAVDDPTPGIIVDRPDRARMVEAYRAAVEAQDETDLDQA